MQKLKNYIYIIIGLLYILVYKLYPNHIVFSKIEEITYGKEALSYFNAIVVFFITVGVISLLYVYARKVFQKIAEKTDNKIDDILIDMCDSFILPLKYVVAFFIASRIIVLPERIAYFIAKVASIIFLVLFLVFLTKFINILFEKELIGKSKLKSISKNLLPFVNKIIIAIIWVVGVITILSNLWYDVSALIAGAGIWGIAVALAAQKSIANMFGAITILMNKPFKIGDYVTINGHTGTVKDIGLSYLTLTDRAGHQVMIPNETIISTSIENESMRKYRRADFSIGVVYGTPQKQMEKWVKIIEDILQKYVDEEKLSSFRVNFEAFWDFSLNLFVTYFSNTNNYTEFAKEKETINLEIKQAFEKAKIDMAFPTQELIIKKWDLA